MYIYTPIHDVTILQKSSFITQIFVKKARKVLQDVFFNVKL